MNTAKQTAENAAAKLMFARSLDEIASSAADRRAVDEDTSAPEDKDI